MEGRSVLMADKCVMKCIGAPGLAAGYTKVRVKPKVYSRLVLLTSVTNKTMQDTVEELLDYALNHVSVEQEDGSVLELNLGGTK
jgi:hypothetical protein